ncbi:E motif [Dillenia turbinata]|uniref:E motif n=1 Tax=Dillenia turbinata TaxID=194707 RepID=A0AAN8Z652_9MAGN
MLRKSKTLSLTRQNLRRFSSLSALKSDLNPNIHTLNPVLSICSSLSALKIGKEIHGYILRLGLLLETLLGNALITMYAKGEMLALSLRVFEGVDNQDACSHAVLVDDGIWIFNSMVNDYGIAPTADHLSCMVDLLGRAGYLNEEENLLNCINLEAGPSPWWTLFSACAAHENLSMGRIVAAILLETEQNDSAVYILLLNIYAAAGLWEEAATIRELMEKTRFRKQCGCSWVTSQRENSRFRKMVEGMRTGSCML